MQRALAKFYGKLQPGSVGLIYFSGYGIQSARQSYMIPVDAQVWAEADVRRDGFSLDAALAEMNSRGSAVKIAILDASRRNPFERRFRSVSAGLGARCGSDRNAGDVFGGAQRRDQRQRRPTAACLPKN